MDFGQILSLVIMFFFIMAMLRFLFPAIYLVVDWICGLVGVGVVIYWLAYGIHKVFGLSW